MHARASSSDAPTLSRKHAMVMGGTGPPDRFSLLMSHNPSGGRSAGQQNTLGARLISGDWRFNRLSPSQPDPCSRILVLSVLVALKGGTGPPDGLGAMRLRENASGGRVPPKSTASFPLSGGALEDIPASPIMGSFPTPSRWASIREGFHLHCRWCRWPQP